MFLQYLQVYMNVEIPEKNLKEVCEKLLKSICFNNRKTSRLTSLLTLLNLLNFLNLVCEFAESRQPWDFP